MDDFIRRRLITVETMYVNEVKKEKMTIVCVINWLLLSHIHLLITHIHQGIVEYLGWNMEEGLSEIKRLSDHKGYPMNQQVLDPILL